MLMMLFASLFCGMAEFFCTASTILFLHCFYDTRYLFNKKKLLVILLFSLLACASSFVLQYWQNAMVLFDILGILEMILLVSDYKGKKFWAGVRLYLCCSLFASLLSVYTSVVQCCIQPYDLDALMVYMETQQFFTEALLIAYGMGTVFFGCLFPVLYRMYRNGVVMRCGKREIFALLGLGLLGYVMLVVIIAGIDLSARILLYALAIVTVLLVSLFSVYLFSSRTRKYYRQRTALQESHIQAELAHFQQYQQSQEETSRFRHDFRNHLLCLNELLQQNKGEEASAYVAELLETVETASKRYVTGDLLLDSILAVKAQTMEDWDISFELDGVLAGGLPWKPVDICSVFANAMDNAIEACQKVPAQQRYISFSIRSTPQYWFVTIENPVDQAVDTGRLFRKNGGYSSKATAAGHGIGTYNMKYTVESYGDMLKAECTDRTFTLEIMVDKKLPEEAQN